MDKYLGTVLNNRYEILEIIGNGGMSVVYKARDLRLNRLVAIKILKDDAFADEELRTHFRTESEAVAQLNHPNIVNIFDVSSTSDVEYIVMELVDGITLHQYMKKRGILPMKEVIFFTTQILKALEHAHSRNIIHRDIKPQNMMLLRDGTLKVTDFGIARIASKQNTLTNSAFGSVHYISPEQARGEQTDGRTDIYSLGVILYEMLTGRLPFEGDSPLAVAMQHLNSEPMAPSRLNPEVPPAFEAITLKAMSVVPEKRYPTARAMLDDVEQFKRNPDMTVTEEPDAPENAGEDGEGGYETKKLPRLDNLVHVDPAKQNKTDKTDKDEKGDSTVRIRKPDLMSRIFKGGVAGPVIAGVITTLLVVGLAAGALIWAFTRGTAATNVTLPNIVGKTVEEAQAFLAADSRYANLRIIKDGERNDPAPKGQIIEMKPKEGKVVRTTSTINVTISLGPVTVLLNDVSGRTSIEGTNALKTYLSANGLYGLTYQTKYETSDLVAKDVIIRTEPAAGSEVKEGDVIYLIVSSGPDIESVPMPDLLGLNVEVAKSLLADNKLTCEVEERYDISAPAGTVIGQSVAAKTMVEQTTVIKIIVSLGEEPTVPDVTQPPAALYVYPVGLPVAAEPYSVVVQQDDTTVYTGTHDGSGTSQEINIVGVVGSKSVIKVYVNGNLYSTSEVEFAG